MNRSDETPVAVVKKKNVFGLIEYCIENKIEFSVRPKNMNNDDSEIEFTMSSIKKAIALGMFLREQKIELSGVNSFAPSAVAPSTNGKASRKTAEKVTEAVENKEKEEDIMQGLVFDQENN
jgi:hypothetical protein